MDLTARVSSLNLFVDILSKIFLPQLFVQELLTVLLKKFANRLYIRFAGAKIVLSRFFWKRKTSKQIRIEFSLLYTLENHRGHNKNTCNPEGWGFTQQIFIQGSSAPKSNPLPFYIPFFTKKVPLSCTFY